MADRSHGRGFNLSAWKTEILLGPSIYHLVFESQEKVEICVEVSLGPCGTPEI